MADPTVSSRAAEAAVERDFGAWESTIRVNTRSRTKVLLNAIPMVVVGFGGLIWTALTENNGPIWSLSILLGLIGVLGAGLCVAGYRLLRVGHLLVHRFTAGFIVERERGAILSAPYATVDAQVIDFSEPGDSGSPDLPHVALKVTFADGDVLAVAEPRSGHPGALVSLAERCRSAERITLPYPQAQRLLHQHSWL